MSGQFFVRAKTLSIVDNFIALEREKNVRIAPMQKTHSQSYPAGSIFGMLAKKGIHENILSKIYDAFERFEFSNTPSVGEGIEWYNKNPKTSVYDALKKITLDSHSVRVAENALFNKEIDIDQRSYVSLFGLVHDIGKSSKMCDFYGVHSRSHELASSELIEILFSNSEYETLGKNFSKELLMLDEVKHGDIPYKEFGFYGKALHEADALAREQELKTLGISYEK